MPNAELPQNQPAPKNRNILTGVPGKGGTVPNAVNLTMPEVKGGNEREDAERKILDDINAKERAKNTMGVKAVEFQSLDEFHSVSLERSKKSILDSRQLFETQLNLEDLPDGVREATEKKFDDLGKTGAKILEALEEVRQDPLSTNDLDILVGRLYAKVHTTENDVRKVMEDKALVANSPKAKALMQQTLAKYKALVPEDMYEKPMGTSEDIKRQMSIAGRLMLIVLGGAYTAFSVVTGLKTKNFTPVGIGMAVVAGSIYGPKRLMEGKLDIAVRETEFLNDPKMDAVLRKYNINGDNWAKYIESLQGKVTMRKVRAIEQSTKKTDKEKKREMEDLFELQRLSPEVKTQMAVLLEDKNDRAFFVSLMGESLHKETKDVIVRYVQKGGRSKDVQIALDPKATYDKFPEAEKKPEDGKKIV